MSVREREKFFFYFHKVIEYFKQSNGQQVRLTDYF